MDGVPAGLLGLETLYEPTESPTAIVIAVHGLGSNPKRAWVRKADAEAGQEADVNWLSDRELLPSVVPTARILAFNYESGWLIDAPNQRAATCALQLLISMNALDPSLPLIFIGHSFGGIVIAEALVIANQAKSDFEHIAARTKGLVFLGTPFQGSGSAKWGEIVAHCGRVLGLGSDARLLSDLRDDSNWLQDLLGPFSRWLVKANIETVCAFERRPTACAKSLTSILKKVVCTRRRPICCGRSSNELFQIVEEQSAWIHGTRKLPLDADHKTINKYSGPNDSCYKAVSSIVREIVELASETMPTQTVVQAPLKIEYIMTESNKACLRSLLLTDPVDDFSALRRQKGDRIKNTCEWLLGRQEYCEWLHTTEFPMLVLTGSPGVGKTMMSMFLVEELRKRATVQSEILFAYFFCDNKDEKRKTDAAILRSFILQLLRQDATLFRYLQPDFDAKDTMLFQNFDALSRIFLAMLKDPRTDQVILLLDALDECREDGRTNIIHTIKDMFSPQGPSRGKVRLLITSRPEIEQDYSLSLSKFPKYLRIDSAAIQNDLTAYIDEKVGNISISKKLTKQLTGDIKKSLINMAGSTFLQVSLVTEDIERAKATSLIRKKLENLPDGLYDFYDRILDSIDMECKELAKLILQILIVARTSLNRRELAVMLWIWSASQYQEPTDDNVAEYIDAYTSCGPFLHLDPSLDTIVIYHQSVRDYLLSPHLKNHQNLASYFVDLEQAHLESFLIFWKHMLRLVPTMDVTAGSFPLPESMFKDFQQYQAVEYYFCRETLRWVQESVWQIHANAAASLLINEVDWSTLEHSRIRPQGIAWLSHAASKGQVEIVKRLLGHGACKSDSEYRDANEHHPIFIAARRGHQDIVKILLQNGASIECKNGLGWTLLLEASQNDRTEMMKFLIQNGADVNAKSSEGATALHYMASRLGWDQSSKDFSQVREEMIELLHRKGANMLSHGPNGVTPLHLAYGSFYDKVIWIMLARCPQVDIRDAKGRTTLFHAIERLRNVAIHARSLKLKKATVIKYSVRRDSHGRSALHHIAHADRGPYRRPSHGISRSTFKDRAQGDDFVKLLVKHGANVNAASSSSKRAPNLASSRGNCSSIYELVKSGACIEAKDKVGRTPLHLATLSDHPQAMATLLDLGANVNAADSQGQTPLHLLCAEDRCFRWLDPGGLVDLSATIRHKGAMERLMRAGADFSLTDDQGRTARDFAHQSGNGELFDELVGQLHIKKTPTTGQRSGAVLVDNAEEPA
ncbi:MAG: hypothetical protein M1814_003512 [Vezdaea aestivalis]|nr:MAG: hypothetical protein M1814_003512 [Vezdaea aestivalis]